VSEAKMFTIDADALLERLNAPDGEVTANARITDLEELFRVNQHDIREEVERALGYEQAIDAWGAVRRLAERFQEANARIAELETHLAKAATCGLCGERPTEKNHLFICCENCTDIGVSNVPKEVFELQRQRDAAVKRAEKAETVNGRLLVDLHNIQIRAFAAETENARLHAALRELDWHNPLSSDFDTYCHELARWGLGKVDARPNAAEYGLNILIPDNVLAPEVGQSKTSSVIVKALTNQHGQPFAVYLSDGQKIGIQRDGGAAWLRIETTPIVREAGEGGKE
jgi:hypothetical protein